MKLRKIQMLGEKFSILRNFQRIHNFFAVAGLKTFPETPKRMHVSRRQQQRTYGTWIADSRLRLD